MKEIEVENLILVSRLNIRKTLRVPIIHCIIIFYFPRNPAPPVRKIVSYIKPVRCKKGWGLLVYMCEPFGVDGKKYVEVLRNACPQHSARCHLLRLGQDQPQTVNNGGEAASCENCNDSRAKQSSSLLCWTSNDPCMIYGWVCFNHKAKVAAVTAIWAVVHIAIWCCSRGT